MTKEMVKGLENKSREFYEFVLPPVDMYIEDDSLTVVIDMPGFKKEEIDLSRSGNVLAIRASKDGTEERDMIHCQRPRNIDKRVRLPDRVSDDEQVPSAKYSDGILTVSIPLLNNKSSISID